jgi:hypothetical protein
MVRRNRPDPLQPHQVPTWLVTRNKHRQPVEWREIAAGADPRAILQAARSEHSAIGWVCDDIGPRCGFYFCERAGEYLQVGIERYDPDGPDHPAHSG